MKIRVVVEAVANRSIDLGLTIGSLNFATLRQTVVRKGQFALVESGPKKNWSDDLESKSFILTEPRLETEKLKAGYKKQFGRSLPILFEINSWEVIGQLVLKGLGVGLLPDISVKNWQKSSFRILKDLKFECSYEIYVHTSKSSHNRIIEYVRSRLLEESS